MSKNYQPDTEINEKYKVWFFAGGETNDNKFNIFTGTFIRLMDKIFGRDFGFVKGIFYRTPMMNVIWALNHAQKPLAKPEKKSKIISAFDQIIASLHSREDQLVIISSSTGSVTAAQTACFLAQKNLDRSYLIKPFHLVLGASMISPESELFKKLILYQADGLIGKILHAEVQDEGDSSAGVGGLTKREAYSNAFGLMFPFFSGKYDGPSFLNTNPETGHIHRRRSKTVRKALDYIRIILIEHSLAGEEYRLKADTVIKEELLNRERLII